MNQKQNRIKSLHNQCKRINNRLQNLVKINTRYSWYRLSIFLFGLFLTIAMMMVSEIAGWIVLISAIIIFNIVAYYHRKIDTSIKKHKIWYELKSVHIARANLDWEKLPPIFQESICEDHPFEIDLDISGKYSLHRLLNISLSYEGSKLLYDWLLSTQPDINTINERQQLIEELIPLVSFRDRLILNLT